MAAERNLDIGSPGGMESRWASLGELFVVEGQSHVRSQLGRRKKERERQRGERREKIVEPEREKERYVLRVVEEGGRAEGGTKRRKRKRKKERRKEGRKGRGTLRLVEQRHGTLSTSRKNSIEAASFCRV